ncbi:MOSC domain-containing protein [Devosia rhizoryzae]|uniref:MOSC N-terminal beta barrel domain-containing protein n=1 Tax=Devosia rhizoryzae TaxID=2774137 RepID=A0ABX7C4U2_9HYPH|nr:MOSC N-terminal beta barrel domain-containing protein [Devosia rhizoryzae]QQR39262.1 MOSC N-terminal beta barrel domain-containing protein [Devosia rhizoryzae]
MNDFSIADLWIYPVKSLGGMKVSQVTITEGGSFAGDREWLVVDLDGKMLWQGDLPRMTLLSATLESGHLTLRQPDGDSITIDREYPGTPMAITQYGYEFDSVDAGTDAAAWLSAFLNHSCRLVRIGGLAHRWGGLNPVHTVSLRSLEVLNKRMAELAHAPIEVERLRPNVVLGGYHEAFAEERCSALTFTDAAIHMVEPCIRCELPNISRLDATRQRQPLKLIGTMSKERQTSKPASFGMYGRAQGSALTRGDIARDAILATT